MKIQLISDLHLEMLQRNWPGERLIAPMPGADVLVLAGDIADGAHACKLFAHWPSEKKVPIIYVAGNHEHYGHVMDPMLQKLREGAALNGIHFLENDGVEIDGVRFLGATMWTDYGLRKDRSQRELMDVCARRLNDHRLIRKGRSLFEPEDALARHEQSRQWLQAELAKPFSGQTVVVSHHGPHPLSVHPRYGDDDLSAGFVSDLTDLMPGVDLWLHGHVHDSFDYEVGKCRVVANPAGYVRNRSYARDRSEFVFENEAFDRNKLIAL